MANWLPTLITPTEGFDRAIKLARTAVKKAQTDAV
ncbi:hexameric tyrosine-coordinated heme protein [Hoeflea sp.]|jgi:hypothetical protein|nr:hexameric tyrosine-coordinated heme protein [Hoeflea sp.]MBC7285403.1 hypothetical protein [Hoeflea sp.]